MKLRTKIIILVIICLIILIGGLILNNYLTKQNKNYLIEITYDELLQKTNNNETFIFLISQTTCTHCKEYKPKLNKVANKYKINVYYIEINLLTNEERNELKKYFSISGTPQTVFVIDGYEETAATRIVGNVSEEKIINKFKSNGFIE